MHILLTNDDGFDHPSLRILCLACARRGHRVTVSAPAEQQSAKSHAFTLNEPLRVFEDHMPGAARAFRVTGTPADCSRLGLMALAEQPVDLVISGINEGYNAGLAVYVSGTVGAARETAFLGTRSMSASIAPEASEAAIERFAEYCVRLGEKLADYPAPALSVCNVNAPCREPEDVRGARMAQLSLRVYKDEYEGRVSPRGVRYYWLKYEEPDTCPDPRSDVGLLRDGYVTITFLTPEPCAQEAYIDFPLPLNDGDSR